MSDISKITPLNSSTTYDIKALSLKSQGRVTTANFDAWDPAYRSKITTMLASSSMDSSGTKPPCGDGYLLNFGWDTTAGWGAQLAIQHTTSPHVCVRGCNGGTQESTWGNWYWLPVAAVGGVGSSTSPIYINSSGQATACGTSLAVSITGNAATATKATQDGSGNTISSTYVKKTGDTMTGALTMNKSAQQLIVPYNGTNYDVLHNHNNGNYSLSACGGGLYMGYYNTTLMNWLSGKMTLTSDGNLSNTGWTSQNGPEYQRCTAVTRGTAYNGDFYRTAPEWTDSAGNRVAQIEYHKSASYNELLLYALGDVAASNLYAGLVIRRALGNTGNASCVLDANAGKLYGAVWNDYAEFRQSEVTESGRCIKETGNGDLILTTERLEKGCEIISDTYGFAIGESKTCKTPTAAVGRVLAYPYESIEEFRNNIGQAVCSGPNGTVSIMTDQECRDWPQCIIGTISEIPTYDNWYAGGDGINQESCTPIKVNGRIWIRVR